MPITERRPSTFDPPTHAEALAGARNDLAEARLRFATASDRLRRARRYGRDPKDALFAWNLARNQLDHRRQQVAWWRRQLTDHPELAQVPILDRARRPPTGAPSPPTASTDAAGDGGCDQRSAGRGAEVVLSAVRIARS